jgi:predicted N-acetyltransferase YhbS
MLIRSALKKDADSLVALLREAYANERDYFPDEFVSEVAKAFASSDTLLVAEDDGGQLLGCVCAYRERQPDGSGRIGLLAVRDGAGRRGVGGQLMESAEAHLGTQGCAALSIGVLDFKPRWLREWYERLGYTFMGIGRLNVQPLKRCRLAVLQKRLGEN